MTSGSKSIADYAHPNLKLHFGAADLNFSWATGIFEGEGSISEHKNRNNLRLSINMIDLDSINQFHKIVKIGNVVGPYDKGNNHSLQWCWEASTSNEVINLLRHMLPNFGIRRKEKALLSIFNYYQKSKKYNFETTYPKLTGELNNLAWAIGIFEAEGSIVKRQDESIRLSMQMIDLDVLEKFQKIVNIGYINGPYYRENCLPIWNWASNKSVDVINLLKIMLPMLSNRRKSKALSAIYNYYEARKAK